MKFRTPSEDDFRYRVAEGILKHVKNEIEESEIESLKSLVKSTLEVLPNTQMQLMILVPITLPPNTERGFCKNLVERCEKSFAETCGGVTTIHAEGGWFDEENYVKDYHRSLTSIFDPGNWEPVSEKLQEMILDIQQSNKQKCVWLSIDGIADEVNLLPEGVVKKFPNQNEFGDIDPAFDRNRSDPFPDILPAISIKKMGIDLSTNYQSGIVGNTIGNQTIINNYYNIPDPSEPDYVEKNKSITENISGQFRNIVDEKPTVQEPKIRFERTVKYPKVSLPKPGEIYSEKAFRSFFPIDSKLKIDFDDVYTDWENYRQLPVKLMITFVYHTAMLLLSVFSITNLLGLTSIEILQDFEYIILGFGLITANSKVNSNYSGISKLTVNSFNEAFRAIIYLLFFPFFFAVIIIPLLMLSNEIYELIFDKVVLIDFKFDYAYTANQFSNFFLEYFWAYSVSACLLYRVDWFEISNKVSIFNTQNRGVNNFWVKIFKVVLMAHILHYLASSMFSSDMTAIFVFGIFTITFGLYGLIGYSREFIEQFKIKAEKIWNKHVNEQLTLFKNNDYRELSKHPILIDLPVLQLSGNYFPEMSTNINDELFAYDALATRKIICDLIRNKKFNIQRYPSPIKVRILWNLGLFCQVLNLLWTSIYILPLFLIVMIQIFIEAIFGETVLRTYNLTISQNYFNLDHDRIQNEIEPRSKEMSTAQLLSEIGNSTNYENTVTVFAFTDFLCYASGTRHFTQKDKNYRKKRNNKRRK